MLNPMGEFSSLSLYKNKSNSISSLSNQNQRRKEILQRQKEKREEIVSELRFCSLNEEKEKIDGPRPRRQRRRNIRSTAPIGLMMAEWLYESSEDLSSWFVIPCPRGQRCLVVLNSHRTQIYSKYGNSIRTLTTNLPRETILYCIYDQRTSIYHILDLILWNGQDFSTQIECQCRFYMLSSLEGDSRLSNQFSILPRIRLEEMAKNFLPAEDGYLFYHPLGFYQSGYSPLVCWLKPFLIEEILHIKLPFPVDKPIDFTTAQEFMFNEQRIRKEYEEQQQEWKNVEAMSID